MEPSLTHAKTHATKEMANTMEQPPAIVVIVEPSPTPERAPPAGKTTNNVEHLAVPSKTPIAKLTPNNLEPPPTPAPTPNVVKPLTDVETLVAKETATNTLDTATGTLLHTTTGTLLDTATNTATGALLVAKAVIYPHHISETPSFAAAMANIMGPSPTPAKACATEETTDIMEQPPAVAETSAANEIAIIEPSSTPEDTDADMEPLAKAPTAKATPNNMEPFPTPSGTLIAKEIVKHPTDTSTGALLGTATDTTISALLNTATGILPEPKAVIPPHHLVESPSLDASTEMADTNVEPSSAPEKTSADKEVTNDIKPLAAPAETPAVKENASVIESLISAEISAAKEIANATKPLTPPETPAAKEMASVVESHPYILAAERDSQCHETSYTYGNSCC